MEKRKLARTLAVVVGLAAVAATTPTAGGTASIQPQVIDDAQLTARTTTLGGAEPLPTTRTVQHWSGSTLDPDDGVTYGYNMVGADPNTCSGDACDATIEVDITPINVSVGGRSFDADTDVLVATLASPEFALNDYGSTPFATTPLPGGTRGGMQGPGGTLSQGDAGNMLQLQDATMRAQFDKTGANSSYHLRLHPNVHPTVTIAVPPPQGTLLKNARGVVFADVDLGWWATRIQQLETTAEPTHLAVYLTDSVMLYTDNDPSHCCVFGFHGARAVGKGPGSTRSNGNAPVQTFAWTSWIQPGIFSPQSAWALQDIHGLSHEIAEWADDPFVNNTVEPWLTPTAPQYGCTGFLETGDPVVAIGFAMGTNTFQSTDGYYHPEDEALLPWFMRLSPNTISEPTQSPTPNVGRYTLMGDLNPYASLRQPAMNCP
jgi:hypothetical protein